MVRTGPIKVGRFSKSVAASTFDFLQKNAENRLFAVESRVKPPLINTMSDGFQTTNEVFRHLYWAGPGDGLGAFTTVVRCIWGSGGPKNS